MSAGHIDYVFYVPMRWQISREKLSMISMLNRTERSCSSFNPANPGSDVFYTPAALISFTMPCSMRTTRAGYFCIIP